MPFARLYFGAYGNLGLFFITKLGFILNRNGGIFRKLSRNGSSFQGGNDDTYRSILATWCTR
jgi:hypothetical protein